MKMKGEGKHESYFDSHLRSAIEGGVPDGITFKLSESIVYGVPDFVHSSGGKTTWWEVKKVDKRGKIIDKGIQRHNMGVLSEASAGAFYAIFDFKRECTAVVNPENLNNYLLEGEKHALRYAYDVDYNLVVEFIRSYHS